MKHLLLLSIFCVLVTQLLAQNVTLKGQILYQSSNKNPAIGVKIMGQGASPDYSTESGQFILRYSDKTPGAEAGLTIGMQDKFNNYIELVNATEVKNARIPAEPKDGFYIIVCKAGQLAEAQNHYYNIAETKLKKEYVKKLEENKQLIVLAANNANERIRLELQADSINNRYNVALKKVDELASFIASINKDFASDLVKSAIEKIDSDQDIEAAIEILNDTKLEETYQSALLKKNTAETEMKEVVEGYELKISLLLPKFKYKEIIRCYEKIISIWETNKFDSLELASFYLEIGRVFNANGEFSKALDYQMKAISIEEETLGRQSRFLSNSYNDIGITYEYLGRYRMALEFLEKGIKIKEETFAARDTDLAASYNNIAMDYHLLREDKLALEYQKKAIIIMEEYSNKNNLKLIAFYNNISLIYDALGDFPIAMDYQKKSIAIGEVALDKKDPEFGKLYDNIALTYHLFGDNETALQYQRKSMTLYEEILDPKHPILATSYGNIAITYKTLGDYQTAIQYHKKAIAIREEILDEYHPALVISYENISITYSDMKYFDSAIKYQKKAISIKEAITIKRDADLALSYGGIATSYINIKLYSEAISYLKKGIEIYKQLLPEEDTMYALYQFHLLQLYYQKGMISFTDRRHEEAIKYFDTILSYENNIDIHNQLGLCYYYLKKFPDAIKHYQQVVLNDTNKIFLGIQNNLGMAYAKNGQMKEAEHAFITFENQHVDSARSYRNWAMFYALKRNKEKAITNLQNAVAHGYNDIEWITTDESIETIRKDKRYKKLVAKLKDQH